MDEQVFVAAGDLQAGMRLAGPEGMPPLDIMQVEPLYPAMVHVYISKVGVVNMYAWQMVALA